MARRPRTDRTGPEYTPTTPPGVVLLSTVPDLPYGAPVLLETGETFDTAVEESGYDVLHRVHFRRRYWVERERYKNERLLDGIRINYQTHVAGESHWRRRYDDPYDGWACLYMDAARHVGGVVIPHNAEPNEFLRFRATGLYGQLSPVNMADLERREHLSRARDTLTTRKLDDCLASLEMAYNLRGVNWLGGESVQNIIRDIYPTVSDRPFRHQVADALIFTKWKVFGVIHQPLSDFSPKVGEFRVE